MQNKIHFKKCRSPHFENKCFFLYSTYKKVHFKMVCGFINVIYRSSNKQEFCLSIYAKINFFSIIWNKSFYVMAGFKIIQIVISATWYLIFNISILNMYITDDRNTRNIRKDHTYIIFIIWHMAYQHKCAMCTTAHTEV